MIPRPWLDALYDLIARNRINWFGRREVCLFIEPLRRTASCNEDPAAHSHRWRIRYV